MRSAAIASFTALFLSSCTTSEPAACGAPVRTEAEAIAVARLALQQRYGADRVARQEPLLVGPPPRRHWVVVGTTPEEQIAGNFNVVIDAKTGCIIAMQIDQ